MTTTLRHYIAGRWIDSDVRTGVIDVENPADGSVIAHVPRGTAADVQDAVAAARAAFPAWAGTSMQERIALVERFAESIKENLEELAEAMSSEMGVPISFARQAQVPVALGDLHHLINAARKHVAEASVSNSLVVSEPVGVVAAITPWNFPLHQIVLKVGPALLAGCTVILKPSEVAPLNAMIVARLLDELGLPAGVFNLVWGDGPGVGAPLAAHPDIDMVTFTGSRDVGESVAVAAASSITRVTLELGGKSAAIILDDADLDEAVPQVLRACFANSGQTCAALSRVLVPKTRAAAFEALAVKAIASWTPGHPSDVGTSTGPAASGLQRDRIVAHVDRALEQGARVIARAPISGLPESGAYVEPIVLGDITPDMDVFRHEVFGPVLAVTTYGNEREAIDLANDSDFGLSGGVWATDARRALAVARQLRTGTVGINGAGLDVGAPFGGYKQSGVGRECGAFGLGEFFETKSIMGAAGLTG